MNPKLQALTGWTVVCVPGLVPDVALSIVGPEGGATRTVRVLPVSADRLTLKAGKDHLVLGADTSTTVLSPPGSTTVAENVDAPSAVPSGGVITS